VRTLLLALSVLVIGCTSPVYYVEEAPVDCTVVSQWYSPSALVAGKLDFPPGCSTLVDCEGEKVVYTWCKFPPSTKEGDKVQCQKVMHYTQDKKTLVRVEYR